MKYYYFILLLLFSNTAAFADLSLYKVGDGINVSWTPSPDKVYSLMSSDSLNSEFQVIDGYIDTHLEKNNYSVTINSDKRFFLLNQKDIIDLLFPLGSGDRLRVLYSNYPNYINDPNRIVYEDIIIIDEGLVFSIYSDSKYKNITGFTYGNFEAYKGSNNAIGINYLEISEVGMNGVIESQSGDISTSISIDDPLINSGKLFNAGWPEGLPAIYSKALSNDIVPENLIEIDLDLILLDAHDFLRSSNLLFTTINEGLYSTGIETLPFTYTYNKINEKLGELNISGTNNLSGNNFNLLIKLVFTEHLKGYCYSEYLENNSTNIMCGFFGQGSFPVETYNEIPFSEMYMVQDYFVDGKIDSYDLAYQKIISFELEQESSESENGSMNKPIIFPQIHRSISSASDLIESYNQSLAGENTVDLAVNILSDGSYNFITVSNHPFNNYNGDYYKQPGLINDKPYFKSSNQKYLYFYKGASGGIWSWSFADSLPDGISDSFSGGWMNPYPELLTGNFYIFEVFDESDSSESLNLL